MISIHGWLVDIQDWIGLLPLYGGMVLIRGWLVELDWIDCVDIHTFTFSFLFFFSFHCLLDCWATMILYQKLRYSLHHCSLACFSYMVF